MVTGRALLSCRKLNLVGPVFLPIIMEGDTVVLGYAATSSQFVSRPLVIVDPAGKLHGLTSLNSSAHFRNLTPQELLLVKQWIEAGALEK